LVRLLGTAGSRRAALASVLGAASLGVTDAALGKGKGNQKRKGNDTRRRVGAEAVCYNGSPCIPGPGKNLGKCHFGGTPTQKNAALTDTNLKGANLGSANLANADASGANFIGANLDKACLVDAVLTGATITSTTNIASAILCRTTMPDGSKSNAGCGKGTPCCPTCDADHPCDPGEVCCKGRCREGDCCVDADCPSNVCCANTCCGAGQVCNTNQNPDSCCAPAGSCPAGFCGSVPDGCGGQIQCPCGGNLECCGETCVNTATDRNHCGGCNQPCAAWQTSCQAGACTPTCAETCPGCNCFERVNGAVVCGEFAIGFGNCEFKCTSDAQCTQPGSPQTCVTKLTNKDNVTRPMCENVSGGSCWIIGPPCT
jgi:hypothetical protein